ncbi:MAG TPA: hypothetical protein VLA12_16890, partial [Planctomycetaceae bacterium]|nr:hypothetical protein [Planctomycetaceae bacterium]
MAVRGEIDWMWKYARRTGLSRFGGILWYDPNDDLGSMSRAAMGDDGNQVERFQRVPQRGQEFSV